MTEKRIALTAEQVVDIITPLRPKPWVDLAGGHTVALAVIRRDMGAMLADGVEIEFYDPKDQTKRHGSLTDYARAVLAFAGLA